MALIKCPECNNTVSDQAISCPHCGLPFKLGNTKSFQLNELNEGVWVDIRTGLMWSRISIGQEWSNGHCHGKAKSLNADDAKEACRKFNLAGYNDWRLPSVEEIRTIYLPNQRGYDCPDNVLFQPNSNTPGNYWTSSRNKGILNSVLGLASCCEFYTGAIGGADPKGLLYARPVRRFL